METKIEIHQPAANSLELRFADGTYLAEITLPAGAISLQDFSHARLLAAAPALLIIAKKFRRGCENGEHVGEVFFTKLIDEVDAAIASVEGRKAS